MKQQIIETIIERLNKNKHSLHESFNSQADPLINTRYVAIDNLLPEDMANKIYLAFPNVNDMREMKSFREHKRTSKDFENFNPLLADISSSFHDSRIIKLIEEITGIEGQQSDPSFYAGGLSMMSKDNFLNPHLDNSHDGDRNLYRVLNLLYYVTPQWNIANGGNLELWDENVKHKKEIHSKFNRLALMETNAKSWHSVNKVNTDQASRCCVSNYYFSKIDPNKKGDTFHVTSFRGRPGQPLRNFLSRVDTGLRMTLRKVFSQGLGAEDVYSED